METKVYSDRALNIIQQLKVPNFIEIPLGRISGGIWLLWRDTVNFQLEFISSNMETIVKYMILLIMSHG